MSILRLSVFWFLALAKWYWISWRRYQMETFSALLAICAGNSPVPGEFPIQRPVTRSFDVFFDLHQNKRLSKQWWGWWFETPPCPLRRHRNVLNHQRSVHVDMIYKVFKRCCKSCQNLVRGRNTASSTSLLKCDGIAYKKAPEHYMKQTKQECILFMSHHYYSLVIPQIIIGTGEIYMLYTYSFVQFWCSDTGKRI